MPEQKIPFLDLKQLVAQNREEYAQAIGRVLENTAYIGGTEVQTFEQNFSQWLGGEVSTVGCANGTDALTMAAKALNLPPGSEAIVPAMTFIATPAALLNAGLRIKLVDVQNGDWLMDPAKLEAAITKDTRLIVPVHLYGQMAEMDKIKEVADRHHCPILEDAAQAHGSKWKGRTAGHWGDIATFSFYPGKNLGAFGDAGAIVSRDPKKIEYCRMLGNQGGIEKYDHQIVGLNSRLDAIQAAVLNVKLKYIDAWNEARHRIASLYREGLSGIAGLELPVERPEARHVYHLYVVLVEQQQKFHEYLSHAGIGSGIHYPKAIHEHEAFAGSFTGEKYPHAERVAHHGISLPMCPTLTLAQAQQVIKTVRSYFGLR